MGVGAELEDAVAERGDSESWTEFLAEVAVDAISGVDIVGTSEFFRDAFFEPRPMPTGTEAPDPRLRFLITSVFRDSGRTTPWSLRKRPHALQRGFPSGLRRQRGVVCVKQLEHVMGAPLLPCSVPGRMLPGLGGREDPAASESCGEFGVV